MIGIIQEGEKVPINMVSQIDRKSSSNKQKVYCAEQPGTLREPWDKSLRRVTGVGEPALAPGPAPEALEG